MFILDSPNYTCLALIIFHCILHELAHWVVHRTRRFSDETLRYGRYYGSHIGAHPEDVTESGYLLDSRLWGGVFDWGCPYGSHQRQLFRMSNTKWRQITMVAIAYSPIPEDRPLHVISGCYFVLPTIGTKTQPQN